MLRTAELEEASDLIPEIPLELVTELPAVPAKTELTPPKTAEKTGSSHRRLLRSLLAGVALLGSSSALTIPESAPLHNRASLLVELAGSDIEATILGGAPASAGQDNIDESYDYLESNFSLGNGMYKETSNGPSWFASTWSMSQAVEALELMCSVPGKSAYCATFEQDLSTVNNGYWDTNGYDQGPRAFHLALTPPENDDSLWMGIINIRDYEATKSPTELQRAIDVMNIVTSQWDEKDGGIYWMRQTETADDHDRALVSNAPAVILGVELYQQTGDKKYLEWSERIFAWINKTLRDSETGLYNDHISPDGTVDTTLYDYGNGIMAAAMAALSQIDPEEYPLQNAVDLADLSMYYFDTPGQYNNPAFDQIFFTSLSWVANLYNNPSFTARVQLSLTEAISNEPNDPNDLLYAAGEAGLQALPRIPSSTAANLF